MERIIQHFKNYLGRIHEIYLTEITDLDSLASRLAEESYMLSRNILQTILEEMNESLRNDKIARKDMGLVMKEKDRERTILTELGEVKFSRDYYFNKNSGQYETPLDQMLGIEKRARIGESISARLVTKATEESYAKSAMDVTGGIVSRQTVRNKILAAPSLEKQPESEEKKQVRTLDIYADEDHAHLQRPGKEKGKKSKMVPLVTVTEGKIRVSQRRNATLNPTHFVDEKMSPNDLWASVEGFIGKVYDLDNIDEIRIHGDGGKWIQKGLEDNANVIHVLDGYHLEKYLKGADRRFDGHNVRSRIHKALSENNRSKVEEVIGGLVKLCGNAKDFEKVQELQTYLFSNWEAAVNRFREDMPGSCTEGQVSHVLSSRFSRNPMGWSEEGLGKLTKLRVYCKNGGEISGGHFKSGFECEESYKEYAKHYLEDRMTGYDLSWMSELKETYTFDTASGTQQAIKNLGKIRTDWLS